MCSFSKPKLQGSSDHPNSRPVLQPNCNRAPLLETPCSCNGVSCGYSRPCSKWGAHKSKPSQGPNNKSPLLTASNPNCTDHILCRSSSRFRYTSSAIVKAPGSIAAARREQVAILQEQRKMRIAHYGRANKLLPQQQQQQPDILNDVQDHQFYSSYPSALPLRQEKRCSFITPNSDPIYVAYHDQEWGVPAHDDKLLFELLVLTGAQVGSDWTSVLRRRQNFRDAFSRFDAEAVSKFSEKKMSWMSSEYGIELNLVRGVVDNSNRILEVKKEFGSLDKYLWGFVNEKPMVTRYKWGHKIPAKTSKSETISKDMVRRGFRFVGPTVIHSFMQAAGLTNDHLTTCPRHAQCQLPN